MQKMSQYIKKQEDDDENYPNNHRKKRVPLKTKDSKNN